MIYSIRRFSEEDYNQQPQKKGSGLLGKLAVGTAVVGGGLLAGRAGMLGSGVQRGIGKATAQVGKLIKSKGMAIDGLKTYQKGAVKKYTKELTKAAGGGELSADALKNISRQAKVSASKDTLQMRDNIGLKGWSRKPAAAPANAAPAAPAAS